MSVASRESEQSCCEECEDREPDTEPHAPVVGFAPEDVVSRGGQAVLVYLDGSPRFANEEVELYDARGIAVTRVTAPDGSVSFAAMGEAQPAEVRRRVMAAIRATVAKAAAESGGAPEVDAMVAWLDDAPDLEALLRGCGIGDDLTSASTSCIPGCSPWAKLWNRACCRT